MNSDALIGELRRVTVESSPADFPETVQMLVELYLHLDSEVEELKRRVEGKSQC